MFKPRTYGVGRICMVEGCGTRLSAYNPSSVCTLHAGAWHEEYHHTPGAPSHREEIARHCALDLCGRDFITTNPAKKYCCDACRMKAFQLRVLAARRTAAEVQRHAC